MKKSRCCFLFLLTMLITTSVPSYSDELTGFDKKIETMAEECRQEVITQFDILLTSGKLTTGQLFDTFYIPIANTYPQKYKTQYDKYCDQTILRIIDSYLNKDKRIIFVIAVDINGYVPTHNSRYTQPLTGNIEKDSKSNRTKRMFNDRTGLAAARNTKPFLLQTYERDTGEKMYDLSIPIFINKQHWGAIRIGYKK